MQSLGRDDAEAQSLLVYGYFAYAWVMIVKAVRDVVPLVMIDLSGVQRLCCGCCG